MKFVVLLIGLISCDIFSNKDFEKLLEGKDGSKSELTSVEVDKDMLMESSKPGGQAGGEQGGKPGGQAGGKPGGQQGGKPGGQQGGKPGGQPGGQAGGQQGGKPGDKKAGGKPGDKADGKEGGNPKISTIKVQDKEAVMVNGDDNNAPKVVIISDQGANKSEEEILKIAEEVKGKSGGDKQGGDKKGGDKKGGDKAPGAPNQGPPKQKLAEDSESLSLLSFETAAGTQEGEKAQESLNNLIQESKKSDGKNSKNKFWTTVLVDNNPRKVLVNVKTITVLESISDKKENKDKKNGKSDKEVSPTIGGVVPKDDKADEKKEKKAKDDKKDDKKEEKKAKDEAKDKKKEEKEEEKKAKDDKKKNKEEEKKAKDKAGDKKDDDKKDDKKAKEVKKSVEESIKKVDDKSKEAKKSVDESVKKAEEKSKEAKKSVEDSKKEQDKSKKEQDKKDKEQDKKEQDKDKKEQDKDTIKYETPDIKPGESSSDDKNSGIFTGIFGNNKESSNKQEGTKRLQNGSKDKIKSTVTSSKMSYVTKIEGTKTKVMPAEDKGKKGGDKEAGSSVSIDKKDKDNKKDDKDKKDEKDKKDKDKDKNKNKDTKDDKDKNKDNKNPLESVIFMGDDVPKNKPQSPSPKPSKDKESSMDDLFFVLKNMPNKSKGKEGKELYVEGDFETPKDNKLEKKKFKFVGLIKSSGK